MTDPDRIERHIDIQASPSRVWRALSDARELGAWFGCRLDGEAIEPGRHLRVPFTIPGHEHMMFDAVIERVEPERLLSWRWHPNAADPALDVSAEPRTLVELTVLPTAAGCRVTVVETGFDGVAPGRRLDALAGNTRGWEWQLGNVKRHVEPA